MKFSIITQKKPYDQMTHGFFFFFPKLIENGKNHNSEFYKLDEISQLLPHEVEELCQELTLMLHDKLKLRKALKQIMQKNECSSMDSTSLHFYGVNDIDFRKQKFLQMLAMQQQSYMNRNDRIPFGQPPNGFPLPVQKPSYLPLFGQPIYGPQFNNNYLNNSHHEKKYDNKYKTCFSHHEIFYFSYDFFFYSMVFYIQIV